MSELAIQTKLGKLPDGRLEFGQLRVGIESMHLPSGVTRKLHVHRLGLFFA